MFTQFLISMYVCMYIFLFVRLSVIALQTSSFNISYPLFHFSLFSFYDIFS